MPGSDRSVTEGGMWKKTCICHGMSHLAKSCFAATLVLIAQITPASPITPHNDPVILWQEPVNVGSRDLSFGPGGRAHQPRGPFRFVSEDLEGTNPKFVIE